MAIWRTFIYSICTTPSLCTLHAICNLICFFILPCSVYLLLPPKSRLSLEWSLRPWEKWKMPFSHVLFLDFWTGPSITELLDTQQQNAAANRETKSEIDQQLVQLSISVTYQIEERLKIPISLWSLRSSSSSQATRIRRNKPNSKFSVEEKLVF